MDRPEFSQPGLDLLDALKAAGQPFTGTIKYGYPPMRYGGEGIKEKPLWCIAHTLNDGHIAAVFGDWRSQSRHDWRSWENGSGQIKHDAAKLQREFEEAQKRAQAIEQKKKAKAAQVAGEIWDHLQQLGRSEYLTRKKVQNHGTRFGSDYFGKFVAVPVKDINGNLKGLQKIYEDGDKRFLPGTAKKACFHLIGKIDPKGPLYLVEGYATGATVHEVMELPTAVCFDAGNLGSVAGEIRKNYPGIELRIAADNDQWQASKLLPSGKIKGNPGLVAAKATAESYGGTVLIPDFQNLSHESNPTDFNDLFNLTNADNVRQQLTPKTPPREAAPVKGYDDDINSGRYEPPQNAKPKGNGEADPPREAEPDEAKDVIDNLSKLPLLQYDRLREEKAKELGIRVSTLDKEVGKARGDNDIEERGKSVLFDEPEPWPDAVDGSSLLGELSQTFTKYAVLPEGAADAVALWVMHTYTHSAARVSPILTLTSPDKRCGKTTFLSLIAAASHRALPASNISAAALFRATELWTPTLLIDEADTFLRNSDELRGVINSGHTRDMAFVIRSVGDDNEPRKFTTWAPKAIALIGKMPPTLTDRSIVIKMRRKTPGEKAERVRLDKMNGFTDIRRKCVRWAKDNVSRLSKADPDTPETLHDRAADNWRPLLAIAETAGGDWLDRAKKAITDLTDHEADDSAGVLLLADIREVLSKDNPKDGRISSANLAEYLAALEERPWPEWLHGKPITARQIAKLLKPFDIKPKNVRIDDKIPKGYELSQFNDAFTRYLPPQSATPLQTNKNKDLGGNYPLHADNRVADKSGSNSLNNNECSGVADKKPLSGARQAKKAVW